MFMVLDKLSDSLKNVLKKIARVGFVDKQLVEELTKEIQKAFLNADVDVKLIFELTKKIKERALNEESPSGLTQKEYLIKIVYEELIKLFGEEKKGIEIDKTRKPFKIMLIGTFGNGKTSLVGKLAKYYTNRGFKVATLGLDVHRPMASQQLFQISKQANVACFIDEKNKDPKGIYREFEKEYKDFDILVVDTAGRDSVDKDLISEVEGLNKLIKPDETLLVLGADLGQGTRTLVEVFTKSCDITGIAITKMDGTAKGGGALIGSAVSGAPIKFLGVGEKVNDIESFNPKSFVNRLLGMGDIESLLEKAEELDKDKVEDLGKRFLKGEFNFLDLYEQMSAMNKMGPLNKLIELIPGFSNLKIPKEMLEGQEDKIKKWKFILQSMTKEELEGPDEVLSSSRCERIARGSGTTVKEVRELLKQYRQTKKMMKVMKGEDPSKLMKKFKGKIPGF